MDEARAFWITSPGRGEIRTQRLRSPAAGELLIRARASAISRGTETLVFRGEVPESEWQRMRCPFQEGEFPAPVKYGYAVAGIVEDGPPECCGRRVFCLHPHQERFIVSEDAVIAIPDDVPDRRATLAANMETAINGLWDGVPGPGDRIAVVGAGVVGSLVGALAARLPGAKVELVDIDTSRATLAAALGCGFASPQQARGEADLVIHASGAPEGLATALAIAGFETTVIEMSWYGTRLVPLGLGRRVSFASPDHSLIAGRHRSGGPPRALVAPSPARARALAVARPGVRSVSDRRNQVRRAAGADAVSRGIVRRCALPYRALRLKKESPSMYSVTVSHHCMIAHSLVGAVFGPAQQLHGATFVVDAELRREALDVDGIVCDIGRALDLLKAVLGELDYRNLDELAEFRGRNTTTEFLAGEIHRRLARRIREGALAPADAAAIHSLRVVLRENPVAWAAFDAPLG